MGNKFFDKQTDRIYPDTPFGDLPSVTTILALYDGGKSGALMGWSAKIMAIYLQSLANEAGDIIIKKDEATEIFKKAKARHKEVSQEAKDIGSQAHNLLEVHLKGQGVDRLLNENPALKLPWEAFQQWMAKENFEFIASERMVCSHLNYAGTLDAIAKKDGKLWVIDFKTSTRIDETYLWQIAAYRECVQDGYYFSDGEWKESKQTIDGGVGVLRLDKTTGLPEWKPYTILEAIDGFDAFMCLNHLYHLTRRKNETTGTKKNGV